MRCSWITAMKNKKKLRPFFTSDHIYCLMLLVRVGDADDFLDCFIIPARIVGGTFQG